MTGRKWIAASLFLFLLAVAGRTLQATDLSRNLRVFLYRPEVFADRSLGPGLPADRAAIQSYLWYVRMDESVRALQGMEALAKFVLRQSVPGLDFTHHKTLTNGDLETLFQSGLWASGRADPTYKFRLLKLEGTRTDDRALPTIARLYDLLVLTLSEGVTDQGIAFLGTLRQLRVLSVPGSLITDQALKTIARLTQLERLSLLGSRVSDQGLKRLLHLPLRQLDLGPSVTDEGLKNLQSLASLEQLDLHQARVSRAGLAALGGLPRIHTLFLGASIREDDLPALSAFKNLQRLDLTGAQISDAGAQTLAHLDQLREIALTNTKVGEKGLKALSGLPRLRYLEISGTSITPEAFKGIRGFAALQVLSFSSDRRLTPADVKPLGRLPALHSIVINGRPLGRPLVRYLQQQAQSRAWGWDAWVPLAEAAGDDEAQLERELELAGVPHEPSARGIRGLPMIHKAVSDLDEVIAAPTMMGQDNPEYNEKNFLGEFTVEAGTTKKKK